MNMSKTDRANADRADQRRRALVLGGGAGLALPAIGLAGCATGPTNPQAAREFQPPRVQVGDRWVYRETNLYNHLPLANVEVTVTSAAPLTCSTSSTRSESWSPPAIPAWSRPCTPSRRRSANGPSW